MSEPTYRVELTHHPENGIGVEWQAAVYSIAELASVDQSRGAVPITSVMTLFDAFRSTREDAFDAAQAWVIAKSQEPQSPSTVLLTEDGDILDPHDAHA